ncbi:MAG: hypothetical protein IT385_27130 [Deltaproteobacteria bacterium]|nr:hypothetical protein [Deltaproteobacteria bacterium]
MRDPARALRLQQRRLRSATAATPFGVGSRVRVVANSNDHSYRIGGTYVIDHVDPDNGAMRARDPSTGAVGNWLRASDLVKASELGWEWLSARIPERDRALLEAFDGLYGLDLKDDVKSEVIAQVDDLRAAILAALAEVRP